MNNSELKEFGVSSMTIPCEGCGIVTLTIDGTCYDCCTYVSMMDNDSMLEDHDLEGGSADNGQ